MQAASLGDAFRPGPQEEVEGVAEDQAVAQGRDLVGIEPADGRGGGQRDEGGRFDRPMRSEKPPGPGGSITRVYLEAQAGRGRSHPASLDSALVRVLLIGAALDRRRVAGDRHTVWLALLRLRDPYLQDALLEGRCHLIGVHAVRQRERAREAAEGSLNAVIAVGLLRMLRLALTRERQDV